MHPFASPSRRFTILLQHGLPHSPAACSRLRPPLVPSGDAITHKDRARSGTRLESFEWHREEAESAERRKQGRFVSSRPITVIYLWLPTPLQGNSASCLHILALQKYIFSPQHSELTFVLTGKYEYTIFFMLNYAVVYKFLSRLFSFHFNWYDLQ